MLLHKLLPVMPWDLHGGFTKGLFFFFFSLWVCAGMQAKYSGISLPSAIRNNGCVLNCHSQACARVPEKLKQSLYESWIFMNQLNVSGKLMSGKEEKIGESWSFMVCFLPHGSGKFLDFRASPHLSPMFLDSIETYGKTTWFKLNLIWKLWEIYSQK